MSSLRSVLAFGSMLGAVAVGFGMWAMIAPAEDKHQTLVKKLPESSPAKMEEARKRNALVMQAIKEAAETNDNILRELGPPIK